MDYRDPIGRMRFLPVGWTSAAAPDPFVVISAERRWQASSVAKSD